MSVIEGSSVSVKTMSDGTLRLSIDIEPRNAQAAFMLFGAPGRAVALAALVDGHGAVSDTKPERVAEPKEKERKGGEWAKLAGMWCADPEFWTFLNHQFPNDDRVENDKEAALAVRVYCDIGSRAELDHEPAALERFNVKIRRPFMRWMQARGIVR